MGLVERGDKDLTGVLGRLVMGGIKATWNTRDPSRWLFLLLFTLLDKSEFTVAVSCQQIMVLHVCAYVFIYCL